MVSIVIISTYFLLPREKITMVISTRNKVIDNSLKVITGISNTTFNPDNHQSLELATNSYNNCNEVNDMDTSHEPNHFTWKANDHHL